MSYYHSRFVRGVGGLKGRLMKRVVSDSWQEMKDLAMLYPDITTLNVPPMGVESYKSKSLPILRIDAEGNDILDEIGSDEVSEHHILVLTWYLRREIYTNRYMMIPEVEKFFQQGIRGTTIDLLKWGEWIDQPETLGLQKLNAKIENCDLGRRSDLNFSSKQSKEAVDKYDRDRFRTDLVGIQSPDQEYESASPKGRERLRKQKPWLAAKWIETYGE